MAQGGNLETTTGTVRKLNQDRGYGFIQIGKNSYFFHRSNVRGGSNRFADLREGDVVNIVIGEPGDKGDRADRVWKD